MRYILICLALLLAGISNVAVAHQPPATATVIYQCNLEATVATAPPAGASRRARNLLARQRQKLVGLCINAAVVHDHPEREDN